MKKNSFLLLLFTALFSEIQAQYSIDWINASGTYNKTAVMGAVDKSDHLVVAGYLQSENIYIRKYDIAGNFLWEATDASGLPGKYQKPIWVTCDESDNIFVAGKRYAIASGWEYPDAIIALKYSPSGSLLWKQEVPVSVLVGSPHPAFNLRCETDDSGNLYIGTVAATPAGFVLVKLDPAGNILFTYNSAVNAPNGFWSMRLKGDRIILAAGGSSTAPVIQLDTAGNFMWSASPLGRGAHDVELDDEGNTYLLTDYSDQVSGTSGEDIIIYKYTSSGMQLWKKDVDLGGNEFVTRSALSSGRLSMTGYGNSSASVYSDWKTIQTDTDGALLWSASYSGTAYNDEQPYYIMAGPDGGAVVTGKGGPSPDPGNLSYMQMVILQYNDAGEEVWMDTPNQYGGWGMACLAASDNSLFAVSSANMTAYHYLSAISTGTPVFERHPETGIHPNPFKDRISISLDEPFNGTVACIVDTGGRALRSFQLTGETTEIDLSFLDRGLYFCHIKSVRENRTVKIIKE